MKVLLVFSLLLLSAGTSKAQKFNAYYYGNVTGAGMILCIMANKGELDKDIAKKWIEQWVQLFKQDPRVENTNTSVNSISAVDEAYKDLKKDPNCKGIL